jgi:hypothetical protein
MPAFFRPWGLEQLLPMPVVIVGAMWLVCFWGAREILRTGAPVGLPVIVMALMFSVRG